MSQALLFDDLALSEFGDELDFYETPRWAVEALILVLPAPRLGRWSILEPAAGRGAMLEPLVEALAPRSVVANELHEGRFAELVERYDFDRGKYPLAGCTRRDFLTVECREEFWPFAEDDDDALVVMNPPYTKPRPTIGLEFVEKGIQLAGKSGVVAALLPLDFATGVERCERIHDRFACSVYPLRRRPHFGGEGSGQRPFAWFVWDLFQPKRDWSVVG